MSANDIIRSMEDQNIFIGTDSLQKIVKEYDSTNPDKNILWTTDYRVQLPIRLKKDGIASLPPITLIEAFQKTVNEQGELPALSHKTEGIWHTKNYRDYFDECVAFGKSLIDAGLYMTAVNIIGFNAPEWNISFFGSMFARCLPVGVYTTSHQTVCEYVARHSGCKLVVAENYELALKYTNLLKDNAIDLIVIYKEDKVLKDNYGGRIIPWADFIDRGKKIDPNLITERMNSSRPGHCCTLVYTSGTTGMPKGVMLSHDNYTWTKTTVSLKRKKEAKQLRMVSYLPLSHVAAQLQDIVGAALDGMHVCFAQPNALQGVSLIETLKEVRPNIFFSVPRVWEKIYQKMQDMARTNGYIKSKVATWAKSLGPSGTILDLDDQPTSLQYKIAKALVFTNVRKALGLDQAKYLIFGAAPLAADIREYFLSLGMCLVNGYGMSECTGPQTISDLPPMDCSKQYLKQAGVSLYGTELKILKANPQDNDGQICYRGRNVFMGYFKNEEETKKTIDSEGFLHSGDMGYLNQNGVLFITGRLKELLITAAGQNIPPVQIENEIKEHIPIVSNVMLIGDGKRYLTCLVTLKSEMNSNDILASCSSYYKQIGSDAKTVQEAAKDPKVLKLIEQGLTKANSKAISRAQRVQTFYVLGQDFTIDNGMLTPTLKLKRKEVLKKYEGEIESMYKEAKL